MKQIQIFNDFAMFDPLIPPTSEQDLLREKFFSYVFHELRTPLTVIHSYAQILQSRLPPTPEFDGQRHISEQIVLEGDEMVEMIEELLEATRIPLYILNLDLIEHDLVELLDTLIEQLPTSLQESLEWSPPLTTLTVMAEGPRLARALRAVLEFAVQVCVRPKLTLLAVEAQQQAVLTILTAGWQLTPAEAESLFDLYRPLHHPQPIPAGIPQAGRLDISLYVAHGLIEGHCGSLTYNPDLPGLIIKLPLVG